MERDTAAHKTLQSIANAGRLYRLIQRNLHTIYIHLGQLHRYLKIDLYIIYIAQLHLICVSKEFMYDLLCRKDLWDEYHCILFLCQFYT